MDNAERAVRDWNALRSGSKIENEDLTACELARLLVTDEGARFRVIEECILPLGIEAPSDESDHEGLITDERDRKAMFVGLLRTGESLLEIVSTRCEFAYFVVSDPRVIRELVDEEEAAKQAAEAGEGEIQLPVPGFPKDYARKSEVKAACNAKARTDGRGKNERRAGALSSEQKGGGAKQEEQGLVGA